MADAGEVLLALYGKIEELGQRAAAALAGVFGLRVREYVYCTKCDLHSHISSYSQYFYNTQVGTAQSNCRNVRNTFITSL